MLGFFLICVVVEIIVATLYKKEISNRSKDIAKYFAISFIIILASFLIISAIYNSLSLLALRILFIVVVSIITIFKIFTINDEKNKK